MYSNHLGLAQTQYMYIITQNNNDKIVIIIINNNSNDDNIVYIYVHICIWLHVLLQSSTPHTVTMPAPREARTRGQNKGRNPTTTCSRRAGRGGHNIPSHGWTVPVNKIWLVTVFCLTPKLDSNREFSMNILAIYSFLLYLLVIKRIAVEHGHLIKKYSIYQYLLKLLELLKLYIHCFCHFSQQGIHARKDGRLWESVRKG